jgi:predicted GIY-YIG superfamily endonuclease
LDDRLFRHPNSGSKATKKAGDWKLVYQKKFETRSEAYKKGNGNKKEEKSKKIYYVPD